jgi:hypothetical protein
MSDIKNIAKEIIDIHNLTGLNPTFSNNEIEFNIPLNITYEKFLYLTKDKELKYKNEYGKNTIIFKKGDITREKFEDMKKNGFDKHGDNDLNHFSKCKIITNKPNYKDSRPDFNDFLRQRGKAKIFTYNQQSMLFNWIDDNDYRTEFLRLRKFIKNNKLKTNELENKEHNLKSNKWYSLNLQPLQYPEIDIGSLEIFGYYIPGFVYYFKNDKDRDNAFKFLNK